MGICILEREDTYMKKYELFMRESADWDNEYNDHLGDNFRTCQYAIKKLHLDERDREVVVVIALDAHHEAIGVHEVSVGDLTSSCATPREIFKFLILCSAGSGILMHTHPSGNVIPSGIDISFTRNLIDCGKMMKIPILDHVIVGGKDSCVSLREMGYFAEREEEKWEQVAESDY